MPSASPMLNCSCMAGDLTVTPDAAIDDVDPRRAGVALNAERWSVRTRIGGFFQRACIRLLGSVTAAGLAVYAHDDVWQYSLLTVGGLALVAAASAAAHGLRFRRQFALKWAQDLEHLILLLAPQRQHRLRVLDVAGELRVSTREAEEVLEELRRRSWVSIEADRDGGLVYLFPSRP